MQWCAGREKGVKPWNQWNYEIIRNVIALEPLLGGLSLHTKEAVGTKQAIAVGMYPLIFDSDEIDPASGSGYRSLRLKSVTKGQHGVEEIVMWTIPGEKHFKFKRGMDGKVDGETCMMILAKGEFNCKDYQVTMLDKAYREGIPMWTRYPHEGEEFTFLRKEEGGGDFEKIVFQASGGERFFSCRSECAPDEPDLQ